MPNRIINLLSLVLGFVCALEGLGANDKVLLANPAIQKILQSESYQCLGAESTIDFSKLPMEYPLFYIAAKEKNYPVMQLLVELISTEDPIRLNKLLEALNLIHLAVLDNKRPYILTFLLEHGLLSDINRTYKYKFTPLHCAAFFGYHQQAQSLIAKGALVNEVDSEGYTPFERAAVECIHSNRPKRQDFIGILKLLINNGALLNVSAVQFHPLHFAVMYLPELVALLLEKGADVNAVDGEKNTPLHKAISERNLKTINALLDCGADIQAENYAYCTPLDYAVGFSEYKIVELLIERSNDPFLLISRNEKSTFEQALHGKNQKMIELLLDKINNNLMHLLNLSYRRKKAYLDADGRTRDMIVFAFQCELKKVKALLDQGAYATEQVKTLIREEYKKLFIAISNNDVASIKSLQEKGLSLSRHLKNNLGETLLHKAVLAGSLDVVDCLVTLDPEYITEQNNQGQNPIHYAASDSVVLSHLMGLSGNVHDGTVSNENT